MEKKLMLVIGLVVGACLLAGCVTAPPLPTKTGKPDVTIDASKSAVFDAVTSEFLDNGYMLKSVNDTKDIAIYSRYAPDMPLQGWESAPVDVRVTVNFVSLSTGVRVIGSIAYIAYPGSRHERVAHPQMLDYDVEGMAKHFVYNLFLKAKQTLEIKKEQPESL